MRNKALFCLVALAGVMGVGGAVAAPNVVAVLTPSADGTLVIDARSHLAWDRCVLGMKWNGQTCIGRAQLLTFAEAKALAEQRWKAAGVRWRLPRVPELRRLVERNRNPPGVNPALFPNAPESWHWSGTSSVNAGVINAYNYGNVMRGGQGGDTLQARNAWAVDMETAEGHGDVNRATPLAVRLVRPAP